MILFLATNDWANMGYSLSRCLQEVGVEAQAICTRSHAFDYPEKARLITDFEDIEPLFNKAEVVVLMHSDAKLLQIAYDLSKKKLAVFHGGSEYREKPDIINEVFNDKVYVSLVQTGNLLGLGAKNEYWLLPPIDTDRIQPVYDPYPDRCVVGHFPRGPHLKGSELINKTVRKLHGKYDFVYLYNSFSVPWSENMRRISRCDIYICAMKPELNGRKYGGGIEITDLEAAAMGKVVITHFLDIDRYEKEYGHCALSVANKPDELEGHLETLLSLNPKELLERKKAVRAWVCCKHSFKAIGKKLKEALQV